jgi:hypothetical protein
LFLRYVNGRTVFIVRSKSSKWRADFTPPRADSVARSVAIFARKQRKPANMSGFHKKTKYLLVCSARVYSAPTAFSGAVVCPCVALKSNAPMKL